MSRRGRKPPLLRIDAKMAELSEMRRTLADLVHACAGDGPPRLSDPQGLSPHRRMSD